MLQEWQREITCSICRSYLCEPVTIGCGHSFCRACLSWSWRVATQASSCPECSQVSQPLQNTEEQSQCARHKKVLKVFCEDDQTPLCVRCSQSPEHGAHKLSPVEEAAHNCREKLQYIQRDLGKHLEEAEKLFAEEETLALDWHWMIMGEYNKLHYFLM
ncbi:tripartite motif-containing protein 43-like [Vombatus ursinus]|uniref:tripartite motif-containing protein 43-like n=1 Tax=Vombatus ursinus TaxID=29139 RepID=UPI000FFD2BC1|nr:tripartite motif-containing protein 43-like [Vombatus ursinus]